MAAWLAKSEGRDKLGRTVQYFARFLNGYLAEMVKKDASFKGAHEKAVALQGAFATARRTDRIGKELNSMPALVKALKAGDWPEVVHKVSLTTFLMIDRYAWLCQAKLVKQDHKPIIKRALKFLTLSWTIMLVRHIRTYLKLSSSLTNDAASAQKASEEITAKKWEIFKHILCVVQGVHISGMYEHHDMLAGVCGMYTSFDDAMKQYPKA